MQYRFYFFAKIYLCATLPFRRNYGFCALINLIYFTLLPKLYFQNALWLYAHKTPFENIPIWLKIILHLRSFDFCHLLVNAFPLPSFRVLLTKESNIEDQHMRRLIKIAFKPWLPFCFKRRVNCFVAFNKFLIGNQTGQDTQLAFIQHFITNTLESAKKLHFKTQM